MIRLFIAMPLPPSVQEYLDRLIADLHDQGADVKWVAAKNIHLTIRFLGDTDEQLVQQLASMLDAVGSRFSSVDTIIDKFGGFPHMQLPNIFWVGLKGQTELLAQFATATELAIRPYGFAPENRPFRAHLTLGRVKKTRGLSALLAYVPMLKIEPVPIHFDRIVLYQSTLTPKGAVYSPLHETKLKD